MYSRCLPTLVVREFYYNATPKAPPKREYGEAIRTQAPRITDYSPYTLPFHTQVGRKTANDVSTLGLHPLFIR